MNNNKGKKIAVLSGKGGTGKTLVSVNLAALCPNSTYIDCDVEEPNGHLFFRPEILKEKIITQTRPQIDDNKCNGCKKCVEFCRFNALAYIKKVMVFDDICHSCDGCALVCPQKAITMINEEVGKVHFGKSLDTYVKSGFLKVGKISGSPIISNLLKNIDESNYTFIDCPPGSACAVMESIKDADYCILVSEPTIFGACNLEMVHKLVNVFHKKFGVILNKYTGTNNPSLNYCLKNNIEIIGKIPYSNEIAKLSSVGKIIVRTNSSAKKSFEDILEKVLKKVTK
ncbi:MAG: ATP-binding protein [Clostridia bacterium]